MEGAVAMFKFLSIRGQLRQERQRNQALQSNVRDLENAVVEIAEIAAATEEAVQEVQSGEDIL